MLSYTIEFYEDEIYYNNTLLKNINDIKCINKIIIYYKLSKDNIKKFKDIFKKFNSILVIRNVQYDELYECFDTVFELTLYHSRDLIILSKIKISYALCLNDIKDIIVITEKLFSKIDRIELIDCDNVFINKLNINNLDIVNCRNIFIKKSNIRALSIATVKYSSVYLIKNNISEKSRFSLVQRIYFRKNNIRYVNIVEANHVQFKDKNCINKISIEAKHIDGMNNIFNVKVLNLFYVEKINFNFYRLIEKLDYLVVKNVEDEKIIKTLYNNTHPIVKLLKDCDIKFDY